MKRIRKISVMLVSLAAAFILNACGARLDLTDEEIARVVNYSANILQKHNSQKKGTLADVSDTSLAIILEEEEMQEVEEARRAARREQRKKEEEAAQNEDNSSDNAIGANDNPLIDTNASEFTSLTQLLGLDGFEIAYTGYDIMDSYPESVSENDLMFGINAASGDDLLVLHFDVKNLGGEQAHCSVLEKNPSFRLKINGDRHSLLKTLLMDDLSTFDEDMEGGETRQAVLVAEISEAKASGIETIVLTLKKDGTDNQMILQGSDGAVRPTASDNGASSGETGDAAEAGADDTAGGETSEQLDQEEFDEVFGDILDEFAEDGETGED